MKPNKCRRNVRIVRSSSMTQRYMSWWRCFLFSTSVQRYGSSGSKRHTRNSSTPVGEGSGPDSGPRVPRTMILLLYYYCTAYTTRALYILFLYVILGDYLKFSSVFSVYEAFPFRVYVPFFGFSEIRDLRPDSPRAYSYNLCVLCSTRRLTCRIKRSSSMLVKYA